MSLQIGIVDKTGIFKITTVKNYKYDDLYKKCGFKSSNNFDKICEYQINETQNIKLYGKCKGTSPTINKFILPTNPNIKIYGNFAIILYTKSDVTNLSLEYWNGPCIQRINDINLISKKKDDEDDDDEDDEDDLYDDEDEYNNLYLTTEVEVVEDKDKDKDKDKEEEEDIIICSELQPEDYDITPNQTQNNIRKNVVNKFLKIINNELSKINLERGIYNYTIKEATTKNIPKTWDNKKFIRIYTDRIYSIYTNLTKNSSLLKQVNDGSLLTQTLAFMSHYEMFPERWDALIEKKMKIDKNKFENTMEASTDTFTCRKCKSKKCTYCQVQTRSADEPMTTFVTCLACGNKWKC